MPCITIHFNVSILLKENSSPCLKIPLHIAFSLEVIGHLQLWSKLDPWLWRGQLRREGCCGQVKGSSLRWNAATPRQQLCAPLSADCCWPKPQHGWIFPNITSWGRFSGTWMAPTMRGETVWTRISRLEPEIGDNLTNLDFDVCWSTNCGWRSKDKLLSETGKGEIIWL